jgi:hypothetical protein
MSEGASTVGRTELFEGNALELDLRAIFAGAGIAPTKASGVAAALLALGYSQGTEPNNPLAQQVGQMIATAWENGDSAYQIGQQVLDVLLPDSEADLDLPGFAPGIVNQVIQALRERASERML